MALRNQPYIPLYIQDYLTDEKLSLCSWSTQGIYIKILCILHKQKEYGKLLFKQNDKQNLSTITNFAQILIRLLPCQLNEMEFALGELIDNDVLQIDGCNLQQKRMIKDGLISDARSEAAKKGGGNPNLFKQNPKDMFKQKDKQKPEYEIEVDNEVEINNKTEIDLLKNQKPKTKNQYLFSSELETLLFVFNEVFKTKYESIESLKTNYAHWRQFYEPAQIEQAIINASKDSFWKGKMTPVILFRQKNQNKESVDYIGDLLNRKPELTKKQEFLTPFAEALNNLR